jgi:hypothetical protein
MSQPNKLILPRHLEGSRPLENVRATPENKHRFNLPQEMLDEVRKELPAAKEVAQKIQEILERGNAAQVALVCQGPVREFLTKHVQSLLPQIVQTLAQADRSQIYHFFQQLCHQRVAQNNLSAERIDKTTYELALQDFMSLISRVPAQVFPIEIGLPDLGLESPETESEDTKQGE